MCSADHIRVMPASLSYQETYVRDGHVHNDEMMSFFEHDEAEATVRKRSLWTFDFVSHYQRLTMKLAAFLVIGGVLQGRAACARHEQQVFRDQDHSLREVRRE